MKAEAQGQAGFVRRAWAVLSGKRIDARVVDARPRGMMSDEELLAYEAKSKPPQSWYEETEDPFAADPLPTTPPCNR